jgi:virginiamycin B lyase
MPDITMGPDGALWFTQSSFGSGPPDAIGRMSTDGRYRRWPLPTRDSAPTNITAGPDGALWFTERTGFRIGRITTGGKITEFGLPRLAPTDITSGKDGALWFTTDSRVGRITTKGAVTTWRIPGAKSLIGIAAAPDGSFWIADGPGDALRRFVPPKASG